MALRYPDAAFDLAVMGGLRDVATRQVTVERTFAGCDDFWSTCLLAPTLGPRIETTVTRTLAPADAANPKEAHRIAESGTAIGKMTLAGF